MRIKVNKLPLIIPASARSITKKLPAPLILKFVENKGGGGVFHVFIVP